MRLAPRVEESRRLTTAQLLLEVRDVRVRYGGVEAVAGATVAIEAPQIVGLIGPNGAGVLFPAPLGPTTRTISDAATESETSRTTLTPR